MITQEQLSDLFKKHHIGLVYFAEKLIGNLYAEDIVVDCFIKLSEVKIENINSSDRMRFLLYRIVRNRCMSVLKGKYARYNRMYTYSDNISDTSDEYADVLMIKSELINILVDKRNRLSKGQREVFDLHYIHGLKVDEIAQVLGLSINTIRVQKMRLTKEFRIFSTSIFNRNRWYLYHHDGNKQGGTHYLATRYKKLTS